MGTEAVEWLPVYLLLTAPSLLNLVKLLAIKKGLLPLVAFCGREELADLTEPQEIASGAPVFFVISLKSLSLLRCHASWNLFFSTWKKWLCRLKTPHEKLPVPPLPLIREQLRGRDFLSAIMKQNLHQQLLN